MKSVRLVIPDLFLPEEIAADATAGLALPALQKLLARGTHEPVTQAATLQTWLGRTFFGQEALPVAALGAAYDGLDAGHWLRADPVNLRLQRDRLLLSEVLPGVDEAAQLCASLNQYLAGQGMQFVAPHPQRWYVRCDAPLQVHTTPLYELLGRSIRHALPTAADAARLHQLFNEVQMLLHAHPVNEAREARGELPVNSVWFWGEGSLGQPLPRVCAQVSSDDELLAMVAAATHVSYLAWQSHWQPMCDEGEQLLVWTALRAAIQRGNLVAWRDALQVFETGYAQPLWQALRKGEIARLTIDVLADERSRSLVLTRRATWRLWRRTRALAGYSIV